MQIEVIQRGRGGQSRRGRRSGAAVHNQMRGLCGRGHAFGFGPIVVAQRLLVQRVHRRFQIVGRQILAELSHGRRGRGG